MIIKDEIMSKYLPLIGPLAFSVYAFYVFKGKITGVSEVSDNLGITRNTVIKAKKILVNYGLIDTLESIDSRYAREEEKEAKLEAKKGLEEKTTSLYLSLYNNIYNIINNYIYYNNLINISSFDKSKVEVAKINNKKAPMAEMYSHLPRDNRATRIVQQMREAGKLASDPPMMSKRVIDKVRNLVTRGLDEISIAHMCEWYIKNKIRNKGFGYGLFCCDSMIQEFKFSNYFKKSDKKRGGSKIDNKDLLREVGEDILDKQRKGDKLDYEEETILKSYLGVFND